MGDDGGAGDGQGGLIGVVKGGLIAAGVLFALIGLADEPLARTIRDRGVLLIAGVIAVAVGSLAAVPAVRADGRRRRWIMGACGLLAAVGVVASLVAYVGSIAEQERPSVSLSLSRTDTGLSVNVTAAATTLQSDEYLYVLVQGLNEKRDLDPYLAEDRGELPNPERGRARRQILYFARVGPAGDGKASAEAEVPLSDGFYQQVLVQAVILNPERNDPDGDGKDTREAEIEGRATTSNPAGDFTCTGSKKHQSVGCARILLPAASGA